MVPEYTVFAGGGGTRLFSIDSAAFESALQDQQKHPDWIRTVDRSAETMDTLYLESVKQRTHAGREAYRTLKQTWEQLGVPEQAAPLEEALKISAIAASEEASKTVNTAQDEHVARCYRLSRAAAERINTLLQKNESWRQYSQNLHEAKNLPCELHDGVRVLASLNLQHVEKAAIHAIPVGDQEILVVQLKKNNGDVKYELLPGQVEKLQTLNSLPEWLKEPHPHFKAMADHATAINDATGKMPELVFMPQPSEETDLIAALYYEAIKFYLTPENAQKFHATAVKKDDFVRADLTHRGIDNDANLLLGIPGGAQLRLMRYAKQDLLAFLDPEKRRFIRWFAEKLHEGKLKGVLSTSAGSHTISSGPAVMEELRPLLGDIDNEILPSLMTIPYDRLYPKDYQGNPLKNLKTFSNKPSDLPERAGLHVPVYYQGLGLLVGVRSLELSDTQKITVQMTTHDEERERITRELIVNAIQRCKDKTAANFLVSASTGMTAQFRELSPNAFEITAIGNNYNGIIRVFDCRRMQATCPSEIVSPNKTVVTGITIDSQDILRIKDVDYIDTSIINIHTLDENSFNNNRISNFQFHLGHGERSVFMVEGDKLIMMRPEEYARIMQAKTISRQ
jgi:hypothetical protein